MFSDIDIDNLIKYLQLLLLFPVFSIIKTLFNAENSDVITMTNPQKSILKLKYITMIYLLFSICIVYPFFGVKAPIIFSYPIQTVILIYSILVFIFCAIVIHRATTNNFKPLAKLSKIVLITILVLILIFFSLLFAYYNTMAYIIYSSILVCFLLLYNFKFKKLTIKNILTSNYFLSASTFSFYIIVYIISVDKKIFTLIPLYLFLFYLHYSLILNPLVNLNKKSHFFYPTLELATLYNIPNIDKENFKSFKIYIYYADEKGYYVCGKEKILDTYTTKYLIYFEDANKSGGFYCEPLNEHTLT